MSDEDEEKLRKIRGHLEHSHRLNLTEARWLVDELIAAKRRHARAVEVAEGNAYWVEKLESELLPAKAKAWDEGYAAHWIGITDAAGDPNPYREER